MNRINPEKLLLSKWTAVQPEHHEKHFLVVKLLRAADQTVTACELEAVINRNVYTVQWQDLRDSSRWIPGWK